MNDALQKFLNFISANFWDWQFIVFVFCAGLIFCFYILNREKAFEHNRIRDFVFEKTGKNDALNCFYILSANAFLIFTMVSIAGVPVPQTHDEFAYLLAADTFLHGRLVNPAPFSPPHFEYFHILIEPVYTAKFPPLQGVFLAIGKVLTGFPIAGVWLAGLLSSLVIYWLQRAFFSLRWSLFGTILWIFAPLNLVWSDSYWGGHLAVIGGALSVGAFFRYLQFESLKYLFVWGVGIFLLLNSRLYEGTVLTGILVSLWVFEMSKSRKLTKGIYQGGAVFVLIILFNLACIAFYNYTVTQNPLLLPYSLQHSRFHKVPLFVFQKPVEPKAEIPPVIKKLDERWLAELRSDYKNPLTAVVSTAERIPIYLVWLTRSPFLLILFLYGLVVLAKGAKKDFGKNLIIILAIFLAALFLTTFKGDRFLAPIVGIAFVSITLAAKMLYLKMVFGKYLILFLPLIVGGGFVFGLFWLESKRNPLPVIENNFLSRGQIVNFLSAQGGKHLVFLETSEANPADARFYVYNEAEMNAASIIWAHNLSESENEVLIDYHQNRKIWLLKNIDNQAVLIEYESSNRAPEGIIKGRIK